MLCDSLVAPPCLSTVYPEYQQQWDKQGMDHHLQFLLLYFLRQLMTTVVNRMLEKINLCSEPNKALATLPFACPDCTSNPEL